ncbi:transcription repressor OFP14-like [Andrographis paniculata]|uniref:transcription repressor OFP14-like n=1 Tax=Andrographis paniculata TaxID=175694 RepID=UPI0021E97F14|nr:transcription repressor OFP14-like [Andrographis paniculata]
MEIGNEAAAGGGASRMWMKKQRRRRGVSFSARLPWDVSQAFQDNCVCAVKYSSTPFSEIRESIVEVVQNLGIQDWNQMEDLVYCYIALNSSEIHSFIQEAFLSLSPCFL